MLVGRQKRLENKIQMQKAKNKLKRLDGVCILKIFENDEGDTLNEILSGYHPTMSSIPHGKISFKASKTEIFIWIIAEMHLEYGQEYFFLCDGIWVKIKIIDLQAAVKSLWEHGIDKSENYKLGTVGFLLVDADMNCVMEAGSDSRDEYNYLIDIWKYAR